MPFSILEEFKRRRVLRVAGIYILAAWIIAQVADVMFPALNLPEWTITLVVALMVLGFPIAMVLAWAFDVGPSGVTRTESAPSISRSGETRAMIFFGIMLAAGTALLFFLLTPQQHVAMKVMIAVGILIAAATAFLFFLLYPRKQEASQPDRDDLAEEKAINPEAHTTDGKSIAVLPFDNLSGDPENEYFGDGLAEELLNALQKIEGLQVAARTSSFYFRGRKEKIRTIGEELGVRTVLEGSVRKAGDRVRVTAQLINVEDGYHLWSLTYDRQLSDIFAVQDDIARAIVTALEGKLTGRSSQPVESNPATSNVEAYQLYLRGNYLWKRRDALSIQQSIELFKQAIALDPAFARAHASLSAAWHKLPLYDEHADAAVAQDMAERAAREALRLDGGLGEAHATLGSILTAKHEWCEAERAFRKAIEMEPRNATAQHWYAVFLLTTGRLAQALEHATRACDIDPMNAAMAGTRGIVHFAMGSTENSIRDLKSADELGWKEAARAFMGAVHIYLKQPDHAEACLRSGRFSHERVPAALVGPLAQAGLDEARAHAAERIIVGAQAGDLTRMLAFRLLALAGSVRLFELEIPDDQVSAEMLETLWYPTAAPIRRDPRFAELMKRLDLTEHWRLHGWPDKSRIEGDVLVYE